MTLGEEGDFEAAAGDDISIILVTGTLAGVFSGDLLSSAVWVDCGALSTPENSSFCPLLE